MLNLICLLNNHKSECILIFADIISNEFIHSVHELGTLCLSNCTNAMKHPFLKTVCKFFIGQGRHNG